MHLSFGAKTVLHSKAILEGGSAAPAPGHTQAAGWHADSRVTGGAAFCLVSIGEQALWAPCSVLVDLVSNPFSNSGEAAINVIISVSQMRKETAALRQITTWSRSGIAWSQPTAAAAALPGSSLETHILGETQLWGEAVI